MGKKKTKKPITLLLAIIVGVSIGFGGVALGAKTPERIARGVVVYGVPVGGDSILEATKKLNEKIKSLSITFVLDEQSVTIPVINDQEATIAFNISDAITRAFLVGRNEKSVIAFFERLGSALFGTSITPTYTVDRVKMRSLLTNEFSEKLSPAKNAQIVIQNASTRPHITINKEEDGLNIAYAETFDTVEQRIRYRSTEPITLTVRSEKPQLFSADVSSLISGVESALRHTPITLKYKNESWVFDRATLADWITAVPTGNKQAPAGLGLDEVKIKSAITEIENTIRKEPIDAVFEEKNGKVITFIHSQDGQTVDTETTISRIAAAVFQTDFITTTKPTIVDVATLAMPPKITTEQSNQYGIKEIVGIGSTNFKGSPKNRRHNIAIGAKAVEGTLLAPGEEFSLIKILGRIDATTGYLEELVIKGNETKPEYGGGLCQIGSTAFRAVLETGLPVTARQNHSYRVSYYERDGNGNTIGPGKDATIYNPAPDFKFMNDTASHILIMSEIDGDKLSFIFWGAKDGRKAEQTDARVYNVIPPPPRRVIETTTLKPGETKCTEKPHPGSDAVFTYTVTYSDGEVKTKDFFSRYRPWQEVCLVGVDPEKIAPGPGTEETVTITADTAGVTGN